MRWEGKELTKKMSRPLQSQLDSEELGGEEPIESFTIVHGRTMKVRPDPAKGL
tara:strand:- start:128 stop:286 length:159 start_codon:yes stop_codon:yes gene_type:complete